MFVLNVNNQYLMKYHVVCLIVSVAEILGWIMNYIIL